MTNTTIHEALKSVAAHCDHARNHDTVGFSGLDASFANKMADADRISAKQEWYVAKFVRKYRRQVIENFERNGAQITQGLKGKAKNAAIDAFLCSLVWEHQSAEEIARATKAVAVRTIGVQHGATSGDLKAFVVRFPYSPAMVETFKSAIDWRDREFDKKDPKDAKWLVKPQPATIAALCTFAQANGFTFSDGATAALAAYDARKAA